MNIKIYKASSYKYTPFENFVEGDLDFLVKNGIEIVSDAKNADIIISQNYKHLRKYFWRGVFGNKKFLIWTLESRFDTHFKKEAKAVFGLIKYHVMNVYTKDVFVTNTTFHSGIVNKTLEELPRNFKIKNRKMVALMSFYKGLNSEALIKDGKNIDLIALRTEISLKGNETNAMDIYGKGWPNGISKENSREGDWVSRKKELLKDYDFNLSFENTAAYNYMTEKIWDSIENYCLPVYYGKYTNVYELFPKKSFIDYSLFDSPRELFKFINEMSHKEFVERMNACIKIYNSISKKGKTFEKNERQKMLEEIVSKVNYISKK